MRIRPGQLRESAILIREGTGTWNDYGEWQPGPESRTEIRVASAPVDGDVRLPETEGIRSEDVRTFWMAESVVAAREGEDGTTGDHLEYDGGTWQVFEARRWPGFTEAKAVRAGDA